MTLLIVFINESNSRFGVKIYNSLNVSCIIKTSKFLALTYFLNSTYFFLFHTSKNYVIYLLLLVNSKHLVVVWTVICILVYEWMSVEIDAPFGCDNSS